VTDRARRKIRARPMYLTKASSPAVVAADFPLSARKPDLDARPLVELGQNRASMSRR